MKDTITRLSPLSVIFHWVIGVGVIAMLAVGLYIHDLEAGPEKWQLLGIHQSVGFLILWLAALRILWRFYNGMPKAMGEVPSWQKVLAHIVHGLLLIGTIIMPVSGVIMTLSAGFPIKIFGLELISAVDKDLALNKIARTIHWLGGRILIGVIIIHVLAAVKHHLIDKNNVLKRMLGCKT